jgi:hypothetical protein
MENKPDFSEDGDPGWIRTSDLQLEVGCQYYNKTQRPFAQSNKVLIHLLPKPMDFGHV